MAAIRRALQARRADQRAQADPLGAAERDEPLDDESAVQAGQRNHVADRAERDEIERAARDREARRQNSRRRSSRRSATAVEERHADGGETALAGDVVAAVRIDDRHGGRQRPPRPGGGRAR